MGREWRYGPRLRIHRPYPAAHHDPEEDKKFKWVPFGAGRHRCIGYKFAQIQIRCVWSTLIRNFEFALPDGKFPATNFRTMIHTPLVPTIKYKRRVGEEFF
jgi:sterol 14-demethylase